jgi:Ku70/Ku80 beta-barrel domain
MATLLPLHCSLLLHADDTDKQVDLSEQLEAYRYGADYVPVNETDKRLLKLEPTEVGISVIGTVSRAAVPRHLFCGPTTVLMAPPGSERCALAVSALVQALREGQQAAVVRWVKTAAGAPLLACLIPDDAPSTPFDRLLLHQLPFAEDLRDLTLPSFDNSRKTPSAEQRAAAAALIDACMLNTSDKTNNSSGMRGGLALNPARQYITRATVARALAPDCPLPETPTMALAALLPAEGLKERARTAAQAFADQFTLRKVEGKAGGSKKRLQWSDFGVSQDAAAAAAAAAVDGIAGVDDTTGGGAVKAEAAAAVPTSVSTLTPVEDFEKMVNDAQFVSINSLTYTIIILFSDLDHSSLSWLL